MKTKSNLKIRNYLFHSLCIIAILISQSVIAQNDPPLQWHTFWGAAEGQPEDKGTAIAYTGDYLYITGFSGGSWDVDEDRIIRDYTNYSADGYVAKVTPDGEEVVWLTYLGGVNWDNCTDIKVTNEGIYVCGYSGVWGEYPSGLIHEHWGDTHYPGGGIDAFVAKLDFDGNFQWLTFLGGGPGDFATKLAVDENSDIIYLTGYSESWVTDTYQNNQINPPSGNAQFDAFAAKLETDGDYIWHTFMGGTNGNGMWDHGSGIDFDAAGNVYVGGSSTGTWDGLDSTLIPGFDHNGGADDGFIAKLNPDGDRLWHIFMGTTSTIVQNDQCHDIVVDDGGNIYATGYTWGDWGTVWGTPRVPYGGNQQEDIFVTKINTNGQPQWYTVLGDAGGNQGHDIILQDNGDLYVTGRDGDNNWGNPTLPKPASNSGSDLGIIKLNNNGYLQWHVMAGGWVTDEGSGIVADAAGNIYTTGYSFLPWLCVEPPLHEHTGNPTPNNYGEYHTDIFVAKFDPNASVILIETKDFIEVQGKTITTTISLYDPCFKLSELNASKGELLDNENGTWTWTLNTTGMDVGTNEIIFTANGGEGFSPVAKINLELTPANQPPVFTIDQKQIFVNKGDVAYNFGTVNDPDEDPLNVGSWPPDLSYDGVENWDWSMPTIGESLGKQTITLSAFDGYIESLDYFDVFIKDDEGRKVTALQWLAGQQDDTGGENDGAWNGLSECFLQNDAPVTITSFTLMNLCNNAYNIGTQPFDPSYLYYNQIINGFNYIFSRAQSNGEGQGIYFNDPHPYNDNFTTAVVMMALSTSRITSYIIDFPSNPVVDDKTFKQLMEEMVLYILNTQQTNGSWDNENRVTGNVAYGLLFAEKFGIPIPQETKDKLSYWIDFTQDDLSWGGVNSNPELEDPNMWFTAHLMVEMSLVGDDISSPRVANALNYIADHWCHPEQDWIWSDQYVALFYTIMNAFKLYTIETILTCYGEIDWFADLTNRLYTIAQSYEEGWWHCVISSSMELATNYALLTMTGNMPMPPVDNEPPAIICPKDTLMEANTGCFYSGEIGNAEALDDKDLIVKITNDASDLFQVGIPTIVTWTATDNDGAFSTCEQNVMAINKVPQIKMLLAPVDPVLINSLVSIDFDISDKNLTNIEVDWGDTNLNTIGSAERVFTANHTYDSLGVFIVIIKGIDACNEMSEYHHEYIVVYDPSDGFVTGGGWIDSPEGAYIDDPNLTGKANFGFVSKYKKGQTNPDGNTEFKFHAANLNFHSNLYDWLIIAGPKAIFKGEGTINNSGWYGFQLSAIDANLTPSTGTDLFRIKIWDKNNNDELVYDNKVGELDPNADPTTEISGGSIKIHKSKLKDALIFNVDTVNPETYEFTIYPNPAKNNAIILYHLPENSSVTISLINALGQKYIISYKNLEKGYYTDEVDFSRFSDGIYFCNMNTENWSITKKLIITK